MSFVSSPAVLVPAYRSSQSQDPSTPSSGARTAPITHKGNEAPVKYVVHEIVKILARHRRPLHMLEVEKALRNLGFDGVNISTHKELCELLAANKLVEFNAATKRLAYRNRYESVVSQDALLEFVAQNAGHTGVRVTPELLANSGAVAGWIHELLRHRKLRAIRSNASHLKGTPRPPQAARSAATWARRTSAASTPRASAPSARTTSRACCSSRSAASSSRPSGTSSTTTSRASGTRWASLTRRSRRRPPTSCSATTTSRRPRRSSRPRSRRFPLTRSEKRKRKESKGYAARTRRFKLKMRKIYNTHLFTPQELREGVTLQ